MYMPDNTTMNENNDQSVRMKYCAKIISMTQFQPDESTLLEGRCLECQLLLPIRVLQKHRLFCLPRSKLRKHDKCSDSENNSDSDIDLPYVRKYEVMII